MGLLDGLLGGVLQSALGGGGQQQGIQGNLINLALGMLTKGQGGQAQGAQGSGLEAILGQLTQSGLGDHVKSWVGTGQNMPLSADQLTQAFGQGQVQQWAQQLGLNQQQAAGGLAAALPELINQLTPQGQVPQASQLDGLLGMLRGAIK
jgi:uncharacterized protein YidB (DUF937 family)